MTDRPSDPQDASRADAAAAAADRDDLAVRRLLAEARHDEPMPAEVAARLDGVLAGLPPLETASAATGADRSGVADLGRRRRRVRALLLAAAAAVVVGAGAGLVRDVVGPDGGSVAGSADSAASDGRASSAGGRGSALSSEGGDLTASLPPALGRPTQLSAQRFGQQVHRLEPAGPVPARPVPDGSTCVPGGFRDAALVPVRYSGTTGLLVYRRPAGESRVVDLYLCGQQRPARSVTLSAD